MVDVVFLSGVVPLASSKWPDLSTKVTELWLSFLPYHHSAMLMVESTSSWLSLLPFRPVKIGRRSDSLVQCSDYQNRCDMVSSNHWQLQVERGWLFSWKAWTLRYRWCPAKPPWLSPWYFFLASRDTRFEYSSTESCCQSCWALSLKLSSSS